MFEKVNPCHPDKVADRIAGAVVDLCYTKNETPKVACEVLIGHGECNIQVETSELITIEELDAIVQRIAGEGFETHAIAVPQDKHLAENQQSKIRCGDNGIFKGMPMTHEQKLLTAIAASIYGQHPFDGKYIIGEGKDHMTHLTICQSHATKKEIDSLMYELCDKLVYFDTHTGYPLDEWRVNPLGEWTGGPNTDSGATNRKLGSDMGDAVTGGGLMGKDLSKADVSVNIVCHLFAQAQRCTVTAMCSIGDERVSFNIGGREESFAYSTIVHKAAEYIKARGGFEKFAEWGLIRPRQINANYGK